MPPTLDEMTREGVLKYVHMDAVTYNRGADLTCTGLIVGDYRVHCRHIYATGTWQMGPDGPDEQPLWTTTERAGPQVFITTRSAVTLEQPGQIHLHPGAAAFETPAEKAKQATRPATERRRQGKRTSGGMTGLVKP